VRVHRCAVPLVALLAQACAPPHGDDTASPRGDGTSKDELAPKVLPRPPADVSNRYADDPAAAALGQRLFHDAGFSGALLDLDADGGPDSLGVRGDAGKVSCAGCHEAAHGFLDTRSVFKQISLGTGWTHRRTPALLDVGQAKLIMWGGRHSTLHAQVFGPLESPLEMNSSRLFVAARIVASHRAEYEAIFGSVADVRTFICASIQKPHRFLESFRMRLFVYDVFVANHGLEVCAET